MKVPATVSVPGSIFRIAFFPKSGTSAYRLSQLMMATLLFEVPKAADVTAPFGAT